uniref:DUF4326 domain-containing protein n=1 Tax=Siphoviridae sp. ctz7e2 TaxID=2826526 RepID=A0A8S5M3Y5_9CAUD|nr:MAG TPA: protein of unknown function (DUF4326) [Siphoviridae sp. ctz7e2]DAQ92450.1 MAG TPA: protein of unknown function (DUF4326) [Caudoviricetes sp.]
MRVYIAGPITGTDDYQERFSAAEAALADAGHTPLSPTSVEPPADGTWEGWMRATTSLMVTADGIALLPGWETSRGARIEHDWMTSVGLLARPLQAWTSTPTPGGPPVPVRIQRRSTRGWRMHANAVNACSVPTYQSRWKSPFSIKADGGNWLVQDSWYGDVYARRGTRREAHAVAADMYRENLTHRQACSLPWWFHYPTVEEIAYRLRGRDIACWCPLDMPCHGDVLLDIANAEAGDAR